MARASRSATTWWAIFFRTITPFSMTLIAYICLSALALIFELIQLLKWAHYSLTIIRSILDYSFPFLNSFSETNIKKIQFQIDILSHSVQLVVRLVEEYRDGFESRYMQLHNGSFRSSYLFPCDFQLKNDLKNFKLFIFI
ncbi:hypothetical protein BpHYR1_011061 [Brachionus plicatilis]|uniref:Uncharacterized protein n=1 Tax=Brachionus plicatilis TaxID=10195 RepID=A0A3M7PN67_BRAPC|nr:hypothetical protein BpHYR1_011061 [Brachionus plicatilis]